MWSFKLKMVLWFALLALLPLAVAFYGYDTLSKRSETRRVDAGLEAGLRGAVATYGSRLDAAARSAQELAADPALQRALRGGGPGSVSVVDGGRVIGRVAVSIPVDAQLLRALAGGLAEGNRLVAVRDGRIVAGGNGTLALPPGESAR